MLQHELKNNAPAQFFWEHYRAHVKPLKNNNNNAPGSIAGAFWSNIASGALLSGNAPNMRGLEKAIKLGSTPSKATGVETNGPQRGAQPVSYA